MFTSSATPGEQSPQTLGQFDRNHNIPNYYNCVDNRFDPLSNPRVLVHNGNPPQGIWRSSELQKAQCGKIFHNVHNQPFQQMFNGEVVVQTENGPFVSVRNSPTYTFQDPNVKLPPISALIPGPGVTPQSQNQKPHITDNMQVPLQPHHFGPNQHGQKRMSAGNYYQNVTASLQYQYHQGHFIQGQSSYHAQEQPNQLYTYLSPDQSEKSVVPNGVPQMMVNSTPPSSVSPRMTLVPTSTMKNNIVVPQNSTVFLPGFPHHRQTSSTLKMQGNGTSKPNINFTVPPSQVPRVKPEHSLQDAFPSTSTDDDDDDSSMVTITALRRPQEGVKRRKCIKLNAESQDSYLQSAHRKKNGSSNFTINFTSAVKMRKQCPVCGKVCSRPSTLKTHYLIHTGDTPFKCTWGDCTKSFNVKSNLMRHLKSHERKLAKKAAKEKH
ncbi:C2H2-type zinc finger protein KNAG_0D02290 [Huiozyma naganishii CBS 8797]|uniref:C2H2-type domain-containing protein n=1 Tax=Huiozyma naganishii (strain ATCC MYA-139 / BCRC 22969 / CBS 8797 / KCTC 17520 / NBRC 10181 / NCYC 3082 / Yp74L-3) TaxID=1071383 RepID=J7S5S5_HUIN7|nr:hypothetical protein KNAG_0D02290 [Kazachstania naganishii CBS 8797]CCK69979.1 hypothetical protein KNAG_0D02290 [Kazachstania naganishii CBS 8797]